MIEDEVKAEWEELCGEIRDEAKYRTVTYPNVASQIEKDANEFCNRPTPERLDILSERRDEWNLVHIRWGELCLGGFGFKSS